jgi:hypothetical protein
MKNTSKFIPVVLLFCVSFVNARVIINNNANVHNDANNAQIEEFNRRINSQTCNKFGYQIDSSGECNRVDSVNHSSEFPQSYQPNQSLESFLKDATNEKIKKNKSEIIQRCGLPESSSTKIVDMTDSQFSLNNFNIDGVANPSWLITYHIDQGNVIFGEKQFSKRYCIIDKRTGSASMYAE